VKKELIILNVDKTYARERIAELQKQIQDLGPEFYEVFNQSSETWHDNAPFDALRDHQSLLDAELQRLRALLRDSAISVPKPQGGIVGIGNTVQLQNGKTYFIAGDWTPFAGETKNGAVVVSRGAPLAAQLVGKRVGASIVSGKTNTIIEAIL
jgi:transcription elongation GreA/GreB family factor